MLGFAPLATIPLAGTPMAGGRFFFACDPGVYVLQGGDMKFSANFMLYAGPGEYEFDFGDETAISRRYYVYAGKGSYKLVFAPTRMFMSSFFYGDSEIIRVTPEVTAMRVSPEPRDMVSYPDAEELISTDDQDTAAPPRLRRT